MFKRLLRRAGRLLTADLVAATDNLAAAIDRQTEAIAFAGLEGRVMRFAYRAHDVRLYLPDADHDLVQRATLRARTFFEVGPLEWLAARYDLRGGTVVDAGGYIGNHSIYFALVCGVARCLAFEPMAHAAEIFARNLTLNDISSVELQRGALAEREGLMAVSRFQPGNLGGTHFAPGAVGGVPCWPLDSFGLERCDLLKIDVEGSAPRVILGARDTLSRLRPPVCVELLPAEREVGDRLLTSLGYTRRNDLGNYNFVYEWSRSASPT